MKRRSVGLVVSLAAAIAVASPALGQRKGRVPAKPAAPVSLAGSPARAFPAGTMFYSEISDTASVIDQMGGVGLLYSLVREGFRGTPSNKSTSFPLTEQQFRDVLGSTLAMGILLPPETQLANLTNVDPTIAGLVQSASPEVASLVLTVMKEVGRSQSKPAGPPVASTVRGKKVSTWGTGRSAFAFTQVGDHFAFGDPTGVKAVLDTASATTGASLADVPAFKGANDRVPGRRQFFAFLNGAPIATAFNAGIDQSYKSMQPAPANGKGAKARPAEPALEATALKRFIGMDALVGGSVTALAESGQVTLQAAIELDRTRNGLVGILTDPPIIDGRATALMPNDTDGALIGSIDLVRMYDLVLQTLTPDLSKKLGMPPPPDLLKEFETKFEMRFRDDFLAAFGNEIALGMTIKPAAAPATMARVQDDGAPPPAPSPGLDDLFLLMELRNPAAIRQFIDRSAALQTEGRKMTQDVYRGVDVWNDSSFSFAIVGDYIVLAERKTVENIIVSFQTEQGLMQNSDYMRALGGMPNNAIGVLYVSPDFISMAGRQGGLQQDKPLYPQSLLWTLQKDGNGIYTNFQAPLPDMKNLFDTGQKLAFLEPSTWPGIGAAPRAVASRPRGQSRGSDSMIREKA